MSGTQGSSYSSGAKAAEANKKTTSNIKSGKNASGSTKTTAKTTSSSGNKSVNPAAAAAAKTLATKTAKANYSAYGNPNATSQGVRQASGMGGSTNRSSAFSNPTSASGKGNYGLVNSAPGKGNLPSSGGGLLSSIGSGASSILDSAKKGLLSLATSYGVPTFGSVPNNGILSAPKPQNGVAPYQSLGYMTEQYRPSINSIVMGAKQQQYELGEGRDPGEIGILQQKDIFGRDGGGDIVNAMLGRATIPKAYADRVPSSNNGISVAAREPIGYDPISARYDQQQSNYGPKTSMPSAAYAALQKSSGMPSLASVPAVPGPQSPMSGQGASYANPFKAADENNLIIQRGGNVQTAQPAATGRNSAFAQSLLDKGFGRQPTQTATATASPMSGQGASWPVSGENSMFAAAPGSTEYDAMVNWAKIADRNQKASASSTPVQAASNDPIENPLYDGDSTLQQKIGGYLEQKAEKIAAPFANVAEKVNTALGGSPYNDLYGNANQQQQGSGYSWSSENRQAPTPGQTSIAGQNRNAPAQQQAATIWDSFSDEQRDQLATLEPSQITQVRQYMQQGMSFAEAFAKVKPPTTPSGATWSQPQYTQTWAFTPAGPQNA